MRNAEPLEPEVLAALEAIDATLHGEPVDPDYADLAELSLILRDERPAPTDAFLGRLDRRVEDRFAVPRPRRRLQGFDWRLALGALTAAAALCVAIVVLAAGPHRQASVNGSALPAMTSTGASASSSAGAASSSGSARSSAGGAGSTSGSASAGNSTAAGGSTRAPAPPVRHGRDVSQSAQIGLRAAAGRIAGVAQEVFDVIGAEHGVVLSSHVTQGAGAPGFATFSLQVPAARLQSTLDRLSRLRHAHVITREDASADVTAHVDNTAAALAAARARRRSLLRQLAATDVAAQANRLEREAAQALTQIDRDAGELARLRHRVADSTIGVTVQAPPVVHHSRHTTGGFTFARALHDAGHILLVAAGVALIALAVLVPVGLVVAVCAWVWSLVLRRRREGALDPS